MGGDKPVISVIVPVYNVEAWLKTCLDSIRAQTYENFELILVNDASTDSSGAVCDAYALEDKRLSVVHFPVNRGPSAARNEGIRRAAGKFISFIDADDYVEPDMLERLYVCLRKTGADIAACGADGIKITGGPAASYSRQEAMGCLARGTPFNHVPWGKLYAAEPVKKHLFDEGIFFSEDLLFLYYVLKETDRVSYIPDKLYHYVCRQGSQVHSGVSKRKCTALPVYDRICRDAKLNFPGTVPDFQQQALDVDSRQAMLAVESCAGAGEAFRYVKRFSRHTRRHFTWKAWRLCRGKKNKAAPLLLYISPSLFWGAATAYKHIKRLKDRLG